MFEPMSARLASSFSRKGISAEATETSCFGETSIRVTFSRGLSVNSPRLAGRDEVVDETALLVERGVGLGDGVAHLLGGREIDDLVGDLCMSTTRR